MQRLARLLRRLADRLDRPAAPSRQPGWAERSFAHDLYRHGDPHAARIVRLGIHRAVAP